MELVHVLTFVVGIIAGFVGANVGGGGLVAIPALIFLGLPPHIAIATNKLGSLGMVTSGWYRFHKSKKVNYKIGIPVAVLSLAGAYIGSNALLQVPTNILEKFIGIFILGILVVVLLNKELGTKKENKTKNKNPPVPRLCFLPAYRLLGGHSLEAAGLLLQPIPFFFFSGRHLLKARI